MKKKTKARLKFASAIIVLASLATVSGKILLSPSSSPYRKPISRAGCFEVLDERMSKQFGEINDRLIDLQDWKDAATEVLTPEQQEIIKAKLWDKKLERGLYN